MVNVWFTEEKIEFKFDVLNRATSKDKDKLMIRISGILLPEKKPIYIALCAIFGIGLVYKKNGSPIKKNMRI